MNELERLLVRCVRWKESPPNSHPDIDPTAMSALAAWVEEHRPSVVAVLREALAFAPLDGPEHMQEGNQQRFAGFAKYSWLLGPVASRAVAPIGCRVFDAEGPYPLCVEVLYPPMGEEDLAHPGAWMARFLGYARWEVIARTLGYPPARLLAACAASLT